MAYTAHLRVPARSGLLALIREELQPRDRSAVTAQEAEGTVEFTIQAKDLTALRASTTSLLQALSVVDKMERV